ncbi:hypothetical protein C8Q75DRAFT_607372 [Abortiporus biennis]|nr:hypothetical protein C8Q75DRAFT_607372 [Abortiporus biennis]
MSTPAIFRIHEIRLYLFEIIAPYNSVFWWNKCPEFYWPDGQQKFTDVAHFGFTCKTICDHALDYLWYHLHDLKQILSILPTFKVEEYKDDLGKSRVKGYLTGPIQPDHWARLQQYACRVRMAYCGRDGIEPSVFDELLRWSQGRGLFENLDSVEWEEEKFLHKEPLLFLNPCVKRLTLQRRFRFEIFPYIADPREQNEADEIRLIQLIKENIPDLQYLHIEDLIISYAALQLTTSLMNIRGISYTQLNHDLPAIEELDSLDLDIMPHLFFPSKTEESTHFSMDPDFFYRVARLKNLKFLSLNVEGLTNMDEVQLPRLKWLHLFGSSIDKAEMLKHLSAPRLEYLYLYPEDREIITDDWTDVSACTEVIAQRFPDELHTLQLLRHSHKHMGPTGVSFMMVIRPLFNLPHLRELKMTLGDDICLDDHEVLAIFQSCRRLRSLQIPFIAGITQPTPLCIDHAVKHAPQLWRWKFDLDFSQALQALRSIKVGHASLRRVNFVIRKVPSDIDVDAVATEVHRIFPHIDLEGTADELTHPPWRNILRKVAELQGTVVSLWAHDRD